MRLKQTDIEERIRFVFEECVRFAQMTVSEYLEVDKRDFFCRLPHPHRDDRMICGHLAESKLREISEEAIRQNKLTGRVSVKTMRDVLGPELVKRFLTQKREINRQQIDRLMSWVGRTALRRCAAQIHFVPCHLMYIEEPSELPIGPVTFRSRRSFRRRILPYIRAYQPEANKEWERGLLKDALHYYRGFKWFAEVAIPPADGELSERLAWEAATAALNCLHLIFGANATHKMTIGGPRLEHDNRGHLQIDTDGKLGVQLSMSGPGQVGFASGWFSEFTGSEAEFFTRLCGVALEIAVDPDLQRPISRRVLDAIYWFGEGVREISDAARVVKYVTALERMLMTEEHDDIAKLVSTRCAAFCSISDEPITLAQWKDDALKLYDLRSRLVHGDLSPLSKEARHGRHVGAKIARFAILSVLRHFGEEGLRAEQVSTSKLARWFDSIVVASERADLERS